MEQGLGEDSIPSSGSLDKSRVLDIKPLRCLVPIFPSASSSSAAFPQAPPFMCASPTGPSPSGFTPFHSFSVPPPESEGPSEQSPQTPVAVPNQAGHFNSNNPISTAVPINSFQAPTTTENGDSGPLKSSRNRAGDGQFQLQSAEEGYSMGQNLSAPYLSGFSMHINDIEGKKGPAAARKGKSQKRARNHQKVDISTLDLEIEPLVSNFVTTYNLMGFATRKADGDKDSVEFILMVYNLLRRRITQIEEAKEAAMGVLKRPDLKSGTMLMTKGIRTNVDKRIGTVPGVEVGDIFFFRMEMCLVGLHAPSMAGIDYMGVKVSMEEEPLAVSIVSSGGYEDDAEDGNVLLYSGQGGNYNRKDKETEDQKLERGNLALEKSLHRANEVRVIRGVKDGVNVNSKIYVYDGLYKIQESWMEKGKSGCNVFKYKLVRLPGQPEAFVLWKSIQQWKGGVASRVGIILPDLTSGAEKLPVSLVNDVDNNKGPAYFTYFPSLKHAESTNMLNPSTGCSCKGGCQPNNLSCPCNKKNDGYLPYTASGVIVDSKPVIHECGPSCSCPPSCRNRISQTGLKVYLEVFKTKDKGWGLRSWDPIRAGGYICEYAGEVIDKSKMEDTWNESEDDYIFDATRTYQPPEFMHIDSIKAQKIPTPLLISAKNVGNVARFMNHSCSPNVVWQPVYHGDSNHSTLHVAFYAIKHIPPMTELTYDYGIVESNNAEQRTRRCLCGSSKCRGYFF